MTVASGFTTLPVPTGAQKAHLEAVRAHVVEIVGRAGGWLAFDDYLREVLYAPGIGYYSAGAVKLGADGDFVTAPELSDLFGRCLARQLAPILGSHGQLLELGAGSGALAAVLLPVLADAGWQGEHKKVASEMLVGYLRAKRAAPLQNQKYSWRCTLGDHVRRGQR